MLAQQVEAACRHHRGAALPAPLGAQSSGGCRPIRCARRPHPHGDGRTHSRRLPRGDQRTGAQDWHPQRDGVTCRGCAHGESPHGTRRHRGLGQRLQIGRARHCVRQSWRAAARPWRRWPLVVQQPPGFAESKCPDSSGVVVETGRASLSEKGRVRRRRRLQQPREATRFDARWHGGAASGEAER